MQDPPPKRPILHGYAPDRRLVLTVRSGDPGGRYASIMEGCLAKAVRLLALLTALCLLVGVGAGLLQIALRLGGAS